MAKPQENRNPESGSVRERPILMSAPMVRAILDGRKTVTRRIVKPQPELNPDYKPSRLDRYTHHPEYHWPSRQARSMVSLSEMTACCPYCSPGDRLWVREAFNLFDPDRDPIAPSRFGKRAPYDGCINDEPIRWTACYRADGELEHPTDGAARWKPGIHMPRWASRLTLEVTGIRVERLHDITEEDAKAEGVTPYVPGHGAATDDELNAEPGLRSPRMYRFGFEQVWCDINGADSWQANPWIWVVSFRRLAEAA